MPFKTILMNLITFGWYGLKKLHQMRLEQVNDAKQIMSKAVELKNQIEATPPRMTLIQPYDVESEEYQRRIYELTTDSTFKFFMFNIQQDVFELLNKATDEKAVEIMGMSKGISYLLQAIETNRMKYKGEIKKQPDNIQDGAYV